MNHVILIGRLVRNPDLRYTQQQMAWARFTLAVDRPKRQGQEKPETDFIDCVSFGRQAEIISKYMTKGRKMGIEGRLQIRQWEDKDGGKRRTAEVFVSSFEFCDSQPHDDGQAGGWGGTQAAQGGWQSTQVPPAQGGWGSNQMQGGPGDMQGNRSPTQGPPAQEWQQNSMLSGYVDAEQGLPWDTM